MPTFEDKDFGTITVRRSSLSKSIRVSVAPNGTLRISMPTFTPLFMARRMLVSSRSEIQALIDQAHPSVTYFDGMKVGKSHYLKISIGAKLSGNISGQMIHVTVPDATHVATKPVQKLIHDLILKALRVEAKRYLPRRLAFLAEKYSFSYQNVRFSHASSRWGSCSSNGTISLNIALMNHEHHLIDYVLIHELCHTVEMNHSDRFWHLVEACDSDYRAHRAAMKKLNPHVL